MNLVSNTHIHLIVTFVSQMEFLLLVPRDLPSLVLHSKVLLARSVSLATLHWQEDAENNEKTCENDMSCIRKFKTNLLQII